MQLASMSESMRVHKFLCLHVLSSLQNSCVKISGRPGTSPTTGHVNVAMFFTWEKKHLIAAVQRRYWNLRAVGARLAEGLRFKEDMHGQPVTSQLEKSAKMATKYCNSPCSSLLIQTVLLLGKCVLRPWAQVSHSRVLYSDTCHSNS